MENTQNYQYSRINVIHKKTEPYEIIIAILLPLLGISISFIYNYMGAAITLIGLWIFIKHFLGKSTFITRFIPEHHLSLKLLTFTRTDNNKKNLLLLLPEIFYKSELSPKLEKFYTQYFYIYTFSVATTLFWLVLKSYFPAQIYFLAGNVLLFLLQIIFFFLYSTVQSQMKIHSILLNQKILDHFNKSNDLNNLHILLKPENSIGCMNQIINTAQNQFNNSNTIVINVSPYASSCVKVITEEGVILLNEYEFVNTVQKLNLPSASNRYYLSELLPFRNHNFFGVSFACASDHDCSHDLQRFIKEIAETD
ncbi:MAG: hypothetical protein JXQ65_06945 [Candidatus Marinimicrobia bacterium]|nr:hypothetical protein [Candidatus Neomarinimicrobiota bacterium]